MRTVLQQSAFKIQEQIKFTYEPEGRRMEYLP